MLETANKRPRQQLLPQAAYLLTKKETEFIPIPLADSREIGSPTGILKDRRSKAVMKERFPKKRDERR